MGSSRYLVGRGALEGISCEALEVLLLWSVAGGDCQTPANTNSRVWRQLVALCGDTALPPLPAGRPPRAAAPHRPARPAGRGISGGRSSGTEASPRRVKGDLAPKREVTQHDFTPRPQPRGAAGWSSPQGEGGRRRPLVASFRSGLAWPGGGLMGRGPSASHEGSVPSFAGSSGWPGRRLPARRKAEPAAATTVWATPGSGQSAGTRPRSRWKSTLRTEPEGFHSPVSGPVDSLCPLVASAGWPRVSSPGGLRH